MIIHYTSPQRVETFMGLPTGAVFRTGHNKGFFIKIRECGWDDEEWNALKLDDGEYEYFEDDSEVIRLKAELSVRDDM